MRRLVALLTLGCACQKKICEIGARDQQHEGDRCKQDQQRSSRLADNSFMQRKQHGGAIFVFVGIDRREVSIDNLHLGARLFDGDAGRQSSVAAEKMNSAVVRCHRV